jgi:hypothetical protein
MSNQIAYFQCSTEEDLSFELAFNGLDLSDRTLKVTVRERVSAAEKVALTIGSGLTVTGSNSVKAKVAKASMTSWDKGEYTADLIDESSGSFQRLLPVRFTYDDPGKLVQGVRGASFQIQMAGNQAVVTAVGGMTGPVGPATTLTIGTVTDILPGNPPTASLTGPAGAQVLNLGLVRGTPGTGAPDSADILAIAEKDRLERALVAAGVPEEPSLIVDFLRGVHYAKKAAIAASIATLATALGSPGTYGRGSTATYFDKDGVLKTAAANIPRIEYDPVTRECLGLLLENQARTNLLTYSSDIDNGSYSKARVTITTDSAAAPDGTLSADKIVEDTTAAASHAHTKQVTVTAGTIYTASIFLKNGERTKVRLKLDDGVTATTYASANFDLVAGAVSGITGSGATAGIVNCGNGWFRVWITGTATAAVARTVLYLHDASDTEIYTGDGTSGLYSWGWQLEAGAAPSSYIPTAASTVTRGADALTLAAGQWLVGVDLSAVLEVRFSELWQSGGAVDILRFVSTAGLDSYRLRQSVAVGGADFYAQSGGAMQIDTGAYGAPLATIMRLAFGVDGVNYAYAKDNVVSFTGAAGTPPAAAFDRVIFGAGFMGHIRRLVAYPQRLTNTKVQALSNSAWS